jgi:hypothetical protein
MSAGTGLLDRAKGWLRGISDDEQLAEIRTEIGRREAALAELDASRKSAVLADMKGEAGAAERRAQIDADIGVHRRRLTDLRDGATEIERRTRQAETDRRRDEAAVRPRQAAQLVKERRRLAEAATAAAQNCAEAIMALKVNGDGLAELVGDTAARRFLSFDATCHRVQSALARAFQVDMDQPLTVKNSLIGVASHEGGGKSWWSISDHETTGLDDLCPYFDDRAEAEAAVRRLAERQTKVVIVPLPDDCFTLVEHQWLFASREEAAAAAAGKLAQHEERTAIVAFAGGFALVKRRFAGVVG